MQEGFYYRRDEGRVKLCYYMPYPRWKDVAFKEGPGSYNQAGCAIRMDALSLKTDTQLQQPAPLLNLTLGHSSYQCTEDYIMANCKMSVGKGLHALGKQRSSGITAVLHATTYEPCYESCLAKFQPTCSGAEKDGFLKRLGLDDFLSSCHSNRWKLWKGKKQEDLQRVQGARISGHFDQKDGGDEMEWATLTVALNAKEAEKDEMCDLSSHYYWFLVCKGSYLSMNGINRDSQYNGVRGYAVALARIEEMYPPLNQNLATLGSSEGFERAVVPIYTVPKTGWKALFDIYKTSKGKRLGPFDVLTEEYLNWYIFDEACSSGGYSQSALLIQSPIRPWVRKAWSASGQQAHSAVETHFSSHGNRKQKEKRRPYASSRALGAWEADLPAQSVHSPVPMQVYKGQAQNAANAASSSDTAISRPCDTLYQEASSSRVEALCSLALENSKEQGKKNKKQKRVLEPDEGRLKRSVKEGKAPQRPGPSSAQYRARGVQKGSRSASSGSKTLKHAVRQVVRQVGKGELLAQSFFANKGKPSMQRPSRGR